MKKLLFPLLVILIISIPLAVADEDEDEYEEEEDRMGFGIMEREREHQDDEDLAVGSSTGNMILYLTVSAIVASIGYTAFKIFRTKKQTVSKM